MARFMRSYGRSQRTPRPRRPLGVPYEVTTTTAVTLEYMPTVALEAAFTATNRDDSPEWTSITKKLQTITWGLSRSRERDQFSAGTLEAVLRNEDGRFDTTNSDSPYYPNVKPMKQVRARVRRLVPEVVSLDGSGAAGTRISTPSTTYIDDTEEGGGFFAAVLIDRIEPYSSDGFIMGKWGGIGGRSWRLMRISTGLSFEISNDGTNTAGTVELAEANMGNYATAPQWYSVTWNANTGAAAIGYGPRRRGLAISNPSAATGIITGPIFISTTPITIGGDHPNGSTTFRTLVWWFYYTQGYWLPSVPADDDTAAIAEAPGRAEINARFGSWPDVAAGFNTFDSKQNLDHVAAWSGNVFSGDRGIHQAHLWTLNGTAKLRYENKEFHLFRGYADEWSQEPELCQAESVALRATDGFKVLSGTTLPSGWEAAIQEHIDGNVAGFNPNEAIHWYRLNQSATTEGGIRDAIGAHHGNDINFATEDFDQQSLLTTDTDTSLLFVRSANTQIIWDGVGNSSLSPFGTTESWSICMWFRLTQLASAVGADMYLLDHYGSDGVSFGFRIQIWVDSTDDKLYAQASNLALGGAEQVENDTVLQAGANYFATVTWDCGTKTMEVWLNDSSTYTTNLSMSSCPVPNAIGQAALGNTTGFGNGFDGIIDEVVVFNRALDEGEHRRLNGAGQASPFNFPGSVGVSILQSLRYATWPATLTNFSSAFQGGLDPTIVPYRYDNPDGQSALDFILETTVSDRSVVYMNGRGEVVHEGWPHLTGPDRDGYWPHATISASATRGLPYHSPRFDPSDADLVNEVTITNRWWFIFLSTLDTMEQYTEVLRERDEASAEEYLVRSLDLQTKMNHEAESGGVETLSTLQGYLQQRALLELHAYAQPGLRATGVVLEPQADPARLFGTVLNLAVMDPVEFIHVTPAGNTISDVYRIGGIRHNVDYTNQRWTTSLQLDRIVGTAFWQLEVEGSSELGTTTVLA